MHHKLAVAGLVLSSLGSVALIWLPSPAPRAYTSDGRGTTAWVGVPTIEGQRIYRRQKWSFSIAIGALSFGFVLQLIDLLRS